MNIDCNTVRLINLRHDDDDEEEENIQSIIIYFFISTLVNNIKTAYLIKIINIYIYISVYE